MKNPVVLAEMAKQSKAAADAAAASTEARVKAQLAEEQRLAQLGVEERAKAEAAAAKGAATKAANDAAAAKAELAFSRQLQRAKLVPASEIAESMARTVAQGYAGEGQEITEEHIAKVKAEHAYLFAGAVAAAGSNPAAVAAAGTLSTTPAAGNGAAPPGAGGAPKSANDMTREEFQAEVDKMTRRR